MSEWKCPIDSLDSDIREVVRVLYENNMRLPRKFFLGVVDRKTLLFNLKH